LDITQLIRAARGDRPVDLLLTDARIIDVFTGRIINGHIAIFDGHIAGIGDYPAERTISLGNRFVAPGFIDAHVHIESAKVSVAEFARAVLPRGTTTVIADPHEIANVLGTDGIAWMLAEAERQPMTLLFALPSCVPATSMETSGAVLDAESLAPFLSHERIVGLGEMMNFPGVLSGDNDVMEKIRNAHAHRKPVDGHAPGLSGRDLAAYVAAGISTDHETVSADEAMEKLSAGMYIMIREGTGARNLDALIPVITPYTEPYLMLCTDDRHPSDIVTEGHIDFLIRKAVRAGVDPMAAIRMATINPARCFGLTRTGAVAPGRRADLVVLSDLETLSVEQVYSGGILVAENGEMHPAIETPRTRPCPSAMHVRPGALDLSILADGKNIRVIELIPDQIVTRQRIMEAAVTDRFAVSDPGRDLLKMVVVERHKGTGNIGKGFVTGFGLLKGALASSVAHDSHNIIAVGVDDADIRAAIAAVIEREGGLVVVSGGQVDAALALPIAGLMATEPLARVREQFDALNHAACALGARPADPFMILSFLALPVIPELKLTDRGPFDVTQFAHVPLFAE